MSDRQSRRQLLHHAGRLGLGAAGLVLFGGCGVGPGQGSGGAPAARVATIGLVAGGTDEATTDDSLDFDANLNDLRRGLRELGWVDGQNVRLEIRSARGDRAAQSDLAAELASIPVDVIVARGPTAASDARAATSTLPIVMVNGPADPVARGLAASIQQPGGVVTGLAGAPREIEGKRLELLLEVVPHVTRVSYLGTPNRDAVGSVMETARPLGVQVYILTAETERELELAFEAIREEPPDALLIGQTPLLRNYRARIVDFVAQLRLPALYTERGWAEAGGLVSYGPSNAEMHRRAAFYVDRILRGAKPGDLPIEYPAQYELVINLKTANALGLTIPDALLAQATEVLR